MTDFISLTDSGRKHGVEVSNSDEIMNDDYRFDINLSKPAGATDDDGDSSGASDTGSQALVHDEQQEQNAILVAQTKNDPQDADAWLALASHQRNLVRSDKLALSNHERRVVADLRIAILEKALKKSAITSPGRDRIWMALLEEGNHILEASVIATKWKVALQECSTSAELKIRHVDFVQQNSNLFEFENCKQAYLDCLALLQRHALDVSNGGSSAVAVLQLEVLLRFTVFLRGADFTELAIAIWQVLLEFHFFMPPALSDSSMEYQLAGIEEFWESEAPRIGEPYARGWRYGESKERQTSTKLNDMPSAPNSGSRVSAAAKIELWRKTYQSLPASADEEDTNDPYRFVMFSDLRDILKLLVSKLPQKDLFNACMAFLDLPCLAAEEDDSHAIKILNDVKLHKPISDRYMEHAVEATNMTQVLPTIRVQQESAESLFERDAFAPVPSNSTQLKMNDSRHLPLAHRIIEMLAKIDASPMIFAIYHIAFEVHMSPQTASKTAKHHLFTRSSGFEVLNASAMAEARLKRVDKADRLWQSALQNRSKIPQGEEDAILVWHAAIYFHLHDRSESKALGYLATIRSDSETSQLSTKCTSMSATTLERVRQELITGFDQMFAAGKFKRAILYVDCLALLCYIVSAHDLAEALDVYDMYDTRLLDSRCRTAAELLAQYKADLIGLHLDERRAFKMKSVEESLQPSHTAIPENTRLLAVYHRLTSQDRIRQLLKQPLEQHGPSALPAQTIFRIEREVENANKGLTGSNRHTVRAAFSNALRSVDSPVRHVPSLWFRWLFFEKAQAQSASDKKHLEDATSHMRMLFVEGLKHLPWVKSWITIGIVLLQDIMSEAELERVYNLIMERGLRVRVEFDVP
jgi:hypothetical protein